MSVPTTRGRQHPYDGGTPLRVILAYLFVVPAPHRKVPQDAAALQNDIDKSSAGPAMSSPLAVFFNQLAAKYHVYLSFGGKVAGHGGHRRRQGSLCRFRCVLHPRLTSTLKRDPEPRPKRCETTSGRVTPFSGHCLCPVVSNVVIDS